MIILTVRIVGPKQIIHILWDGPFEQAIDSVKSSKSDLVWTINIGCNNMSLLIHTHAYEHA